MSGPVDTLVCAAGTNLPERRLAQLTPRAWDSMLATNLSGTFYLPHALLPRLREAHGDVVILSSVAWAWPDHTGPAYQAAKVGLLGLARGAGRDEYGNGIRVCTILPGIVNTPILDDRPEPPPRELRDLFVQPPDIAEAGLAASPSPAGPCGRNDHRGHRFAVHGQHPDGHSDAATSGAGGTPLGGAARHGTARHIIRHGLKNLSTAPLRDAADLARRGRPRPVCRRAETRM